MSSQLYIFAVVSLHNALPAAGRTILLILSLAVGCAVPRLTTAQSPLHPGTSGSEWDDLFAADLSNALGVAVWRFEDGLLSASADEILWTARVYDDFVLDLEFRNGAGANSGLFVHASDLSDPVSYAVEIQIADDHHEDWANAPPTWHGGAIFGHAAPRRSAVHPPGQWNRMTITCRGDVITVVLNGTLVNVADLKHWTSAKVNPDGSEIPEWLRIPLAELPTYGHIGLQGMHGNAPIWFRNLRIRPLGR